MFHFRPLNTDFSRGIYLLGEIHVYCLFVYWFISYLFQKERYIKNGFLDTYQCSITSKHSTTNLAD